METYRTETDSMGEIQVRTATRISVLAGNTPMFIRPAATARQAPNSPGHAILRRLQKDI
jgi:hypothetical protein